MNQNPIFEKTRRVEWCETDESGTLHFANYVRFMEETEYAFLRSIGLSVVLQDEKGSIGFPRRKCEFDILQPARFEQNLTTRIAGLKVDGVVVEYRFEVVSDEGLVARGFFQAACCRFPADKPPYAILIPESVMERMTPHAR